MSVKSWQNETPAVFKQGERDADGDGNCFYRALYGAAEERGILEKVGKCFQYTEDGDNCWDNVKDTEEYNDREDAFLYCVRFYLAHRIRSGFEDELLRNTWELFREAGDVENLRGIMTGWLIDAYKNSRNNLKAFVNRVADQVQQPGKWVNELEVRMVTHVLEKCNVLLIQANNYHDAPDALPENPHVLVLVNHDNSHFKYVSYSPLTGGAKRMKKTSQNPSCKKKQAAPRPSKKPKEITTTTRSRAVRRA
ncbi:MAG: hypothetical protein EOM62_20005 [Bacteroidia bacterium]|nr:hypothetical protein [Bacteroidia bacterium]